MPIDDAGLGSNQGARRKFLARLATLQSADIVLPTTDGRKIRLRRVATPTPDRQRLLDQLDITIPAHFEWNAECSGDSALDVGMRGAGTAQSARSGIVHRDITPANLFVTTDGVVKILDVGIAKLIGPPS